MSVKPIRDLFESLKFVHRGNFAVRCDEHMAKCIAEVEASHDDTAKASMTLNITFQKIGDRLEVTANVASKLPPEKPFKSSTFWIVDGALSVQHPDQADFFAGPRKMDERTAG